jgi:nitrite reductase/ring-hydroxylating ferredoxin subunit
MRQILTFVILIAFCFSCTNSDDGNQRNPFLLDVNFSTQNGGIRGLFVINTGSSIVAWEASDPNHAPNDCSLMVIDGINVKCQCDDDNSYNLFTGQSNNEVLEYTMLNYRVNASGNSITVFN